MQTEFKNNGGCLIIAEVGQNHDGSLGAAHAYIDAIARTNADAVKFQTHIACAESTKNEPWRVRFSLQDTTRFDYWKRMEFREEQWAGLAAHAREKGLLFLSSAFSMEAVALLERVGVWGWKVGAGEITNLPMIEAMARTGLPVLLSSGLACWQDLDDAVLTVRRHGAPLGVFQCTTSYPCPPEKLGLNVIAEIGKRYGCPSGLSDHSGRIYSGLAAVTLGAQMLEVHVTFSRECFGPDVPASLTTGELGELVEGVRFLERAVRNPVQKEQVAGELRELKAMFGKSIVAARDLPAGWRLSAVDLALKKPGYGIPPSRFSELIDRKLTRGVEADTLLTEDDIEWSEAS